VVRETPRRVRLDTLFYKEQYSRRVGVRRSNATMCSRDLTIPILRNCPSIDF